MIAVTTLITNSVRIQAIWPTNVAHTVCFTSFSLLETYITQYVGPNLFLPRFCPQIPHIIVLDSEL